MGEHTFGRAAVQKAVPLPEGGLVLTVAKYVSPEGQPRSTARALEPSVPVAQPMSDEDADDARRGEAAEAGDRILEKALEVLKAEAARLTADRLDGRGTRSLVACPQRTRSDHLQA